MLTKALIQRALSAIACIGTVAAMVVPSTAASQASAASNFPDKPVKLVVPFPAGGASDILARLVGKELSELWKQTVLIENKPGAAGHLGGQYVASSKPDGYTMLVADLSSLTMTPSLLDKMTYNPAKELTSVAILAYSPHILVVKNQMPVKTFDEFIAYAKAQKNPVSIGVTLGTATHLSGVVLSKSLGFEYNFIGYKGGAQVVSDLAGGQIDSTLNSFLATYPMVKAGNFRLIAVASPKRFGQIPDTITIGERVPGFVTGSFQGVVTAAGTPPAIVAKINADIMKVVAKPEVQKRFAELGSESVTYNPAEMQKWLVDQTAYWGKVIKDNNIKLQ